MNSDDRGAFEVYFWGRVSKPEHGCWVVPGSSTHRRPRLSFEGRKWAASRLAYFLTHGPIPEGMCVCHHCDNPPCINPEHLFLGTHLDNMRDKVRKGRDFKPPSRAYIGELNPRAKLTEQQVREIRLLHKPGRTGYSERSLAVRFGVSRGTISAVLRRVKWRHVA